MVTDVKRLQRGLFVEYASLAWMTVECVVAIYSGIAAWSLALLVFGGDSLIELLSSFAVVHHLRTSLTGRQSSTAHAETKRVEWVTTLRFRRIETVGGVRTSRPTHTTTTDDGSDYGVLACKQLRILPSDAEIVQSQ